MTGGLFDQLPPEIIIEIYKHLAKSISMKELSMLVFQNVRLYRIFWQHISKGQPDVEKPKHFLTHFGAIDWSRRYNSSPHRYLLKPFGNTHYALKELILDEKKNKLPNRD
jgi:hypothetical protein